MAGTSEEELTVECTCRDQHDEDCLVGFVLSREEGRRAVVFDAEEARALRALRAGGLLPHGVRLGAAGGMGAAG